MTLTLYNLHTDGDNYRVTKFIDGNPEASYLTSHSECQCPAGNRPTCRHRQMLPLMLERNLLNSFLFWDFDGGFSCDMQGNAQRATILPLIGDNWREVARMATIETTDLQPHSTTVSAPDFDSGDGGSNPPAVAKPAWRRI